MKSTVSPVGYKVVARSGDAVTLRQVLDELGLAYWAYPLRPGRFVLAVTWDTLGDLLRFVLILRERLGLEIAGRYAITVGADWRGVGVTTYWPHAVVERKEDGMG